MIFKDLLKLVAGREERNIIPIYSLHNAVPYSLLTPEKRGYPEYLTIAILTILTITTMITVITRIFTICIIFWSNGYHYYYCCFFSRYWHVFGSEVHPCLAMYTDKGHELNQSLPGGFRRKVSAAISLNPNLKP